MRRLLIVGVGDWLFGKKGKRPNADDESALPPSSPSARRVAARALVLATVVCRAYLEIQRRDMEDLEHLRGYLAAWLGDLGISDELEPHERQFLLTSVGRAEEKPVVDASWRGEGLAVLAWALDRFELPAYDESVFPPDPVQERLGFGNPPVATALLDSGARRSTQETSRFASHITIVQWRLRQFRLSPGSAVYQAATGALQPFGHGVGSHMDFRRYLSRHPAFQDHWLDQLRFVDNDLAIGSETIAAASAEEVQRCTSIALERQIAAYWLRGDHATYSNVDPVSLLIAC
jgi:hypothetical protein